MFTINIIIVKQSEFDQRAAQIAINQIRRKKNSCIGFATGTTTTGLHQRLAQSITEQNIDISRIATFNLDEYVGLSKEHPASCYARMNEQFFSQIPIRAEQIHFIDGLTTQPEMECHRVEEEISRMNGIDLQFVGIGLNGHIGFNEPQTAFGTTTHLVDINLHTRKSKVAVFGSLENVPAQGITMGIKTIMNTKKIILLAKGSDKAEIINKALCGPITVEVPASVLQLHPALTVLLDEEAAQNIL